MSDKPASEIPSAPRVNGGVRVEADAYGFYWRNKPETPCRRLDLVSAYNRNKPLPPKGVERRKAFIVGSGIAGLAAAFYLIRDGRMPERTSPSSKPTHIAGGSLDGSGDAETGYLMRGGREMCFTYENFLGPVPGRARPGAAGGLQRPRRVPAAQRQRQNLLKVPPDASAGADQGLLDLRPEPIATVGADAPSCSSARRISTTSRSSNISPRAFSRRISGPSGGQCSRSRTGTAFWK